MDKVFHLGMEKCVGVGSKAVAVAGFVVKSEEKGKVADRVVGDCDGYSFFLRTANEVAGGCTHFLENIFPRSFLNFRNWQLNIHWKLVIDHWTFPRVRRDQWEVPQVLSEEVERRWTKVVGGRE